MTGIQAHTYLAKTSAAERTAYLQKIGLVQRFQRLDPTIVKPCRTASREWG